MGKVSLNYSVRAFSNCVCMLCSWRWLFNRLSWPSPALDCFRSRRRLSQRTCWSGTGMSWEWMMRVSGTTWWFRTMKFRRCAPNRSDATAVLFRLDWQWKHFLTFFDDFCKFWLIKWNFSKFRFDKKNPVKVYNFYRSFQTPPEGFATDLLTAVQTHTELTDAEIEKIVILGAVCVPGKGCYDPGNVGDHCCWWA